MNNAGINQFLDPFDFFGGQANRESTDIQSRMAKMGLGLERDFFNQLREDQAPTRNARDQALEFLRQVQSGEAQLPQDPSLGFRQKNILTDIAKSSAAQGKYSAGGTRMAEQDALAQLQSQSTNNQLNRLLNIAGYQTNDLTGANSLIGQNTDNQANQMGNISAIGSAGRLGQSNAIMNLFSQGSRFAGSVLGGDNTQDQLRWAGY